MSYITTLDFPDDDYDAHRIIRENKKNRELYGQLSKKLGFKKGLKLHKYM
jgi:hypothetical protein